MGAPMEKKRPLKRKLCIAGIGVAALLFFLFLYDSISYEKIVNHRLLDTEGVTFTYNGWTYDMGEKTVDIRYAARLSVPNRLHYWGAFPDKAPYIQIQIPETAVLTIAPFDQDAVLLRVEPMCGLKRVYKLSRYGDFSEYAETLYDITGDPHFQA